jgi:hypothetical protein
MRTANFLSSQAKRKAFPSRNPAFIVQEQSRPSYQLPSNLPMKKSILLAFLASAGPLLGTVFTDTVTGDTYIRNDGTLQNTNNNGDTDNELLIGDNVGSIRGLLAFDVSQVIDDVNTIGGGNFSSLIINSASLELFERRGFARTINVTVNTYGFDFVANTATWNAPAVDDATAGGTIGTSLASENITWDSTSDNQSAIINLASSALATAIQGAPTAGRVNFLLNSTNTGGNNILSITSDLSPDTARHAKLTIDYTVLPVGVDDNFLANGDFEAAAGTGVFPVGWTVTGTPTQVGPFLVSGGGTSAVSLAPSQAILQDFASPPSAAMEDFQADFAFQIGSETQVHRIRLEGNNGADLLTMRLTTNPSADDSIDVFNGAFTPALAGLTIAPDTTYHLRVIGRNFGLGGRNYTVAFSSDGENYTTSEPLDDFHVTPNVKFETITFECGGTAGSSLLLDNVAVTLPPAADFDAWMGGFTFAPGADLTPAGDADNDGISNLVENVFGTAPNAPSTGLTQIASSSGTLSFQHPLNPDLASDVGYTYEWSADLVEWEASDQANTGGVIVNISPAAPVSDVVTVSSSVTGGASSRVFVRLVANQP